MGLLPVVALVSSNALAPLIVLAALAVLIVGPRHEILRLGPNRLAVLLALLALLGAVSAAWSIAPSLSFRKAMQLLPLFAAVYVLVGAARGLSEASRKDAARWLAAGVVAAFLFLIVEAILGGILHHMLTGAPLHTGDSLARYKRGVTLLTLLAGPAVYWSWHHVGRLAALAMLGGLLLSAGLVQSGTAMAAVVVGLLWIGAAIWRPWFGRYGLAVALGIVVLSMPLMRLGPEEIPESLLQQIRTTQMHRLSSMGHRWLIWRFVSDKVAERPVLGWGLDSSRAIPGGREDVQGYSERLPLHPHNASLQIWLELGVFGGLLGTLIAVWPALRIDRAFASGGSQAVAVGVVAATVAVALVGFGIWQSWWVGALGLVAMSTLATLPPHPTES